MLGTTSRLVTRAAFGAAALGAACAPPVMTGVPDPAAARRFEIIDAPDSTFRFLSAGTKWVRVGDVGIAVDPRRRDVLVARFVVRRLAGDTAIALITGQTGPISTTQVALLNEPPRHAVRRSEFWLGAFAGAILGAGTALLAR